MTFPVYYFNEIKILNFGVNGAPLCPLFGRYYSNYAKTLKPLVSPILVADFLSANINVAVVV